jgi:hypothetical protein
MTAENGRLRAAHLRVAAAALAVIGLLAIIAGSPSVASASFDASAPSCLPPTNGNSSAVALVGEGSSLQASAQTLWKTILKTEAHGCGSNAPSVTYESKSSGCGLDAVGGGGEASSCSFTTGGKTGGEVPGYRDVHDRFGASDFAPNPEEEANMNNGPAGGQHAGKIHVIPVAEAAIAVIVHTPEGCKLKTAGTGTAASGVGSVNGDASTGGVNDPTGAATGDAFANETLRVHIPAKALEEIWEHKITEWGKIPTPTGGKLLEEEMEGTPTGGQKGSFTCANFPIYRIVRQDISGTTYNFKAYLSILPSFKGGPTLWTDSEVGTKNIAWPLENAEHTGTPEGVTGSQCKASTQICAAAGGGGGKLAEAIKGTEGSIGYLDLATARKEGFNMEEGKADNTYWVPLEAVNPTATPGTVDTGVFIEPTADPGAHFIKLEGHKKGANCEGADVRGIPTSPSDPTLGDWSKAIATGGTPKAIEKPTTVITAYPVCAITYDLAFDDNAAAYSTEGEEEVKARAVKDYLSVAVSQYAQDQLPVEADYAVLDPTLLADAQSGVAAIDWNKSSGNGGGNNNNNNGNNNSNSNNSNGGSTTGTIQTVVTPPSNAFSVAGAKVKGKSVVLSLVLPGAGKVQIKAVGGGVTVANVTASVGGGQGTVTLPISSAAQKKLAKVKGHKLSVKITVTFTPTGGTAASKTKAITITQAAITPKKKTKKGKKKG